MILDWLAPLLADPEPIVAPTREIRIPVQEPSGPSSKTLWLLGGSALAALVLMLILNQLGIKLKVWFAIAGVVALTVLIVKLLEAAG